LAIVIAILALGFLLFNSRGCYWSPDMVLHGGGWLGAPWRFLTFSGLLQLILGVWVGVDAHKRGSNGYFWGLLVFFTSIIGLLVYLLWVTDAMEKISHEVNQVKAQPSEALACPDCGGEVEDGFKACPACGASLRCPECDKPVRRGWNVCPWCTTGLEASHSGGG
jgi:RNA polymerase subunit RPABC4/transcription elongation factor Spt4